jgi:hypothetical protein
MHRSKFIVLNHTCAEQAFKFLGGYIEGDENNKQVLTSLIEPDARSRKKALKGPKPMKYMDADGNAVKERPPSTTGAAREWLEISSSDDDSATSR